MSNTPVDILQRQKELFLEVLAHSGNVTAGAKAAGWRYPTIAERYRDEDPDFSCAWTDALRQAVDAMEEEARRRAVDGVDEPVYYKGENVGSVKKYSDKLLEMLLKANRPEKFREIEHTSTDKPGVLVVPRTSNEAIDVTASWEQNASAQQKQLLDRRV